MRVDQDNELETPAGDPDVDQQFANKEPKRSTRWWLILFALVTAVGLILGAVLPRIQARANLRKETDEMAVPTVAVIKLKRSAPATELVLPANVQAFVDSPIYARTNGYLKRWYADIGTRVKTGQLLATIETPEVDQQLHQARADVGTAEANLRLAQITAERYAGLLKTDSVSKQDADNAEGDYAAKKAALEAAEANVKRLEELQSFEKIYAPFDGIITARNTDIGALIDSGSSGGTRTELFHIAQPNKLRVYVNVPEAYSQSAKPGLKAALTVPEYPDRRFEGTLLRTADAIDQATRTLLVEIDVNNPTGTLLSGAYAQVHFNLPTVSSSYILPVNSLLFRAEGLRVAAVNNGRAQLKAITIGHDFGSEVEVVAGLNGDESIVVNPPDSLVSGEAVRVTQEANATGVPSE